jgi:hypothetical protein
VGGAFEVSGRYRDTGSWRDSDSDYCDYFHGWCRTTPVQRPSPPIRIVTAVQNRSNHYQRAIPQLVDRQFPAVGQWFVTTAPTCRYLSRHSLEPNIKAGYISKYLPDLITFFERFRSPVRVRFTAPESAGSSGASIGLSVQGEEARQSLTATCNPGTPPTNRKCTSRGSSAYMAGFGDAVDGYFRVEDQSSRDVLRHVDATRRS